ncbi:TPA: hypothetical protein QDB15_005693 [Burkholderia vietnamiensis]|uniref:hypothetical protein n=2 Tax=Burkholderia vietnamiensis TaxID=60552 RepID=UPI0007544D3D|nr:hypothetical protein [Burkholderia vietnamiensis]KVS02604.1 hypothetical protein WK32_16865 [Burkholderia vietnamiensis]MBR8161660.1 hypothetical protein [Burkholderia vietnamiensis]MCA7946746.1 hypothetical protein [Burkholderia vietnamiensis]MCA8211590.1 hypothetical protein [Burkholderia vietnamiensis]MDN7412348.1 hypothetical protein [Burkholderia vietnamiensis]
MTKDMLLPLSAAVARKKSLEHHLALASLQSGNGTADAISKVFQTIYLAYFIHEATVGRHELDQFRAAEAAVVECAVAVKKTGAFEIPADGRAAVEHILLMHDQQLANVPAHVIASAHVRLAQFITTEKLSPIADAQLAAASSVAAFL